MLHMAASGGHSHAAHGSIRGALTCWHMGAYPACTCRLPDGPLLRFAPALLQAAWLGFCSCTAAGGLVRVLTLQVAWLGFCSCTAAGGLVRVLTLQVAWLGF